MSRVSFSSFLADFIGFFFYEANLRMQNFDEGVAIAQVPFSFFSLSFYEASPINSVFSDGMRRHPSAASTKPDGTRWNLVKTR